jgi:hypothetical protein
MKFSFWRKDGTGDRYAISTHPVNAVWADRYLLRIAEGKWMIEGDTSQTIYPTAVDAAEAATA